MNTLRILISVILVSMSGFAQAIRIHPSSNGQPEPYIAVNPTDPNNIVISAVTIYPDSSVRTGVYYTKNGGANWYGTDDISGTGTGDPVVAFDGSGTAYCLYQISSNSALYLRQSVDGGENWSSATEIEYPGGVDKPWMAADDSPNSQGFYNLYITATGNTDEDHRWIRFIRSTDGGSTFTNSQTFTSGLNSTHGSYVSLGLSGEVIIGWAEVNLPNGTPPLAAVAIHLRRSTNGGVSFDPLTDFTSVIQFGTKESGNNFEIKPGRIRADCFPRIAVDRTSHSSNSGGIYVVWATRGSGADDPDVMLAKGTRSVGNYSWSTPTIIFGGTDAQWSPAISVGPDGVMGILYYSRNSSDAFVKVHLARYNPNGSSIGDETLNSSPYFQMPDGSPFIGDYIGVTNWYGKAFSVWTEARDIGGGNVVAQAYYKSSTHTQPSIPSGFAGVTVNQVDDQNADFGKFGRWRQNTFVQYASPGYYIWPWNSTEVLRANQDFKPGTTQKHNAWNTDADVKNHRTFSIASGMSSIKSQFKIANNATLQVQLLDSGNPTGSADFKDPWLIDSTDASHGGNSLNRGINASFNSIPYSQYNLGTSTNRKGVLPDQSVASGNYYSIRAPLTQTLSNFGSNFQYWTSSNASLQQVGGNPSGYDQKAVIFTGTNATVTAKYKANLGSSLSSATGATSQRKLIQDYIHGYYHLVYESAGDVWYTRSTNGGTTWTPEVLLSSGNGSSHNPCFSDIRDNHYSAYAFWVAPTQRYGATGYDIYSKKLDLSSGAWSATEVALLPDAGSSTGLARSDAKPSAVMIGESGYAPIVAVFYEGASTGLKYAYKVWSESWDSYVWLNNDLNNTTTSSARPSTTLYNGYPQVVHVTYDNGSNIYLNSSIPIEYYTNSVYFPSSPTLISVSSQFYNNANSVIAMDSYSNKLIAWTAYDPDIERNVVLERSQMSGNWTSTNSFFSDFTEGPIMGVSVCGHDSYVGGTLYFSDGWVVFNQRTTDGSYWPNMGYIYYGTPITAPNLLSTTFPQTMASFFTKNSAAPYQLKFDLRNNGGGLGKSQMDTSLKQISFDTKVLRRILISDTSGTDGVLLQLGNFRIKNSRTDRVLQFASLEGKPVSGAFSVFTSSDLFSIDETSVLSVETQVKPLGWTKGGAVSIDLVDENGAVKANLYTTQLSVGSAESKLQTIQRTVSLAEKSQKVRVALKVTGIDEEQYRVDLVNQMVFTKRLEGDNSQMTTSSLSGTPESDGLLPSYPNPFNPTTQVPFGLKEGGNVSLVVCDILGRVVAVLASGYFGPGYHNATWNASSVASGVYFVRFVLSDTEGKLISSKVSKLLLMK